MSLFTGRGQGLGTQEGAGTEGAAQRVRAGCDLGRRTAPAADRCWPDSAASPHESAPGPGKGGERVRRSQQKPLAWPVRLKLHQVPASFASLEDPAESSGSHLAWPLTGCVTLGNRLLDLTSLNHCLLV